MKLSRLALCIPACLVLANSAMAVVTLGAGSALGTPTGSSALPIAGLSLLGVAAVGLAIGVRIIRRKRKGK